MDAQFKFSAWTKYEKHQELEACKLPGIYILAHFDRPPKQSPSIISKNIIYIGETTNQDIAKRLYQFGRTAFKRAPAHSGGSKYSDKYLNSTPIDRIPGNLYVAIMGVRPSGDDESKVYIKYLERLAIWLFLQKNRCLPCCNAY